MDMHLNPSSQAFRIREAGDLSVIRSEGRLNRSDAKDLNREVAGLVQSGRCGFVIDLGDCARDNDTTVNMYIASSEMLIAGAVFCLVHGTWLRQWVYDTLIGGPVFEEGADEEEALALVRRRMK